jgi:hypothetical protein
MTRLALLACLFLTACPKNAPTTVAGTADEQMDQLSARLEELKTRTGLQCGDFCSLKSKACGLSTAACDLATHAPERADFQQKCISAQEACASFNESCASCSK